MLAEMLLQPEVSCVATVVYLLKQYHATDDIILQSAFSTLTNLLQIESGVRQFTAMNGARFLLNMLSTCTDVEILDDVRLRILQLPTRHLISLVSM